MSDEPETETFVVHVDRSLCAGHALCAARAPDVYKLDEEGFCISDGTIVGPDLARQAKLGALVCPEGAIELTVQE